MAGNPSNQSANETSSPNRLSFTSSTSRDLIEFFRLDARFFPGASGSGETHEKVQVLSTSFPTKNKTAIKKWKRVKPLGRGTTSTVWLEECKGAEFNQRAVKELSKGPPPLLRSKIDYEKELAALCQMAKHHHAFVNLFGWFESPETVFLCMEYFPLGDLAHCAYEALNEQEVRAIAEQLIDGLDILHHLGWVHRDLKPENIYVARSQPNWWVKLGDFSVSKRNSSNDRMNTMVGTLNFAAPEITPGVLVNTADSATYTSAVDLWSLGVLVYSLLTSRVPFSSNLDLRNYCRSCTPFPSQPLLDKGVSERGQDFVEALLNPDPPARLSATNALKHLWFENLSQRQDDLQSPLIDLSDPSRRRTSPVSRSRYDGISTAQGPINVNAVVEEVLENDLSNGPENLPESETLDFQYTKRQDPMSLNDEAANSWGAWGSNMGRAPGHNKSVLIDSELPSNKTLHSKAEGEGGLRFHVEQSQKPRLRPQANSAAAEQTNGTNETVGASRTSRLRASQKRTPISSSSSKLPLGIDDSILPWDANSTTNDPHRVKRNTATKRGVATISSSSRSQIPQSSTHEVSSTSTRQKLHDGEAESRPQSVLVESRESRPYQYTSKQLSTRPKRRAIAGQEATRSDNDLEAISEEDDSKPNRNSTGRRVNTAAPTKDASHQDIQNQPPTQTLYRPNYLTNSAYNPFPNTYPVSSSQYPPNYMYPYQVPSLDQSPFKASGNSTGQNEFRKKEDPRLAELKELFLADRQDQESRFRAMLKDQEEKYIVLLKEKVEAESKAEVRKVAEKDEQASKQKSNLEDIRATAWQQGRMAGIQETRHLSMSESTGKIPTIVEPPAGFPSNDKENQAPVIMRDELGRSHLLPYSKCRTWFGLQSLIQQAFRHYDDVGASIISGHYDLKNRDDQIILPEAWEDVVVPGIMIEVEVHRPPETSSDESSEEEADFAEQVNVKQIIGSQALPGNMTMPPRARAPIPATKLSKEAGEDSDDPEMEEETSEAERDSSSDPRLRRSLATSVESSASISSSEASGATAGSNSADKRTAETESENSIESTSTTHEALRQKPIAARKLRVRIDAPHIQRPSQLDKTQHAFITKRIHRIWSQAPLISRKILTWIISVAPGMRVCFILVVVFLFGILPLSISPDLGFREPYNGPQSSLLPYLKAIFPA